MAIFGKGNKLRSILGLRCPKCHEGKMFYTSTFSYKRPFDMKERCDVCNEDFFPEPGFYYGAMFVSYVFTAFFCISFMIAFHWVLGMGLNASFGLLVLLLIILFVAIFRLSRVLYINMNVSYDSKAKSRKGAVKGEKGVGSTYGGK